MMHKAVLICNLEAHRFERQIKPFYYFPSCFGSSMSDFRWSHSAALEEICNSCRHKPLVLASVSALQLPGRVEGEWAETSHMVTSAPGCVQTVQISAHNSDPHRGSFTVSNYLDAIETSILSSLSILPKCQWQGWGAWDCKQSQAILFWVLPNDYYVQSLPWTRWYLNPKQQLWCITKVDHPYSCPRCTMYPQGASRYLPVLEVNRVQRVMSLGSLVGRYRSLFSTPE